MIMKSSNFAALNSMVGISTIMNRVKTVIANHA